MFEKHIISLEYLLDKTFLNEIDKIYNILQDFTKTNFEKNKINVKFNLKNLLINCEKEELQGLIFKKISELEILGQKLSSEDILDIILKKISPILPQDIMLLLKYSGFEKIYPKIYDKVLNYYQTVEHSNLYNFLKTMKYRKNIIYSFSNIDKPLFFNNSDKINSTLLGNIGMINIKEIKINSLNSENELETLLENIYSNNENIIKIVVFKFSPNETMFINYIDFFIENLTKEKNCLDENNKIVYIFLIHINRIFDGDEKDPNKKDFILKNQFKGTISHSSDFYQVFIDDLNGEEFTICDVLKLNDQIFDRCLNLKEKFMKNLYEIFTYFDYDFLIKIDELNEINYIKKAIFTLENNKELIDLIINSIIKKIKNELDIGQVLNKYSARDDISIFKVVKLYLSEIFYVNLVRMIFKLEKDNFLSTFVYNQANNNNHNYYLNNIYVKTLIETYLENIKNFTYRFYFSIKDNKILTLLGLRLPGIYNILKEIISYIKNNIKINYLQT